MICIRNYSTGICKKCSTLQAAIKCFKGHNSLRISKTKVTKEKEKSTFKLRNSKYVFLKPECSVFLSDNFNRSFNTQLTQQIKYIDQS